MSSSLLADFMVYKKLDGSAAAMVTAATFISKYEFKHRREAGFSLAGGRFARSAGNFFAGCRQRFVQSVRV